MKKIILINGLIAGIIVGAMFYITMPLHDKGYINFDNGMIVGYTSMILGLSTIFFAVKKYRDEHLNGMITFGRALGLGLLIAVVAAVVYALAWEVYFQNWGQDYMAKYIDYMVKDMQAKSVAAAEIAKEKSEWEAWAMTYNTNPFMRFGFSLVEILPVGLLISLITAVLMRKKSESGSRAVVV